MKPYREILADYGTAMEELELPQEIPAYSGEEELEVPVSWECVDDGFGGNTYQAEPENPSACYVFLARLTEGYELSGELDADNDVPFITVQFKEKLKRSNKGVTGERLSLTPVYESNKYDEATQTLTVDYNNNVVQMTINLTGTTVDEPILKFYFPDKMDLIYKPGKTDATLGPNLTAEPEVLTEGEEKVLVYRFIPNVTQVGFNITLNANCQMKNEKKYAIRAEYYDGEEVILSDEPPFIIKNESVMDNYLTPYFYYESDFSYAETASYFDVEMNTWISSHTHYPYEAFKMTVLLSKEMIPGFGSGNDFTPMTPGETYTLEEEHFRVTYKEQLSYADKEGKVTGSAKALVYELTDSHPFLKSNSFNKLKGNIYIRIENPEDKTYTTGISAAIEVRYDGAKSFRYDYRETTGSASYKFRLKPFRIEDYFYHEKYYYNLTSSTFGDSYSVLPEDTKTYRSSIYNKSSDDMQNVKVKYTFDEKLFARIVSFKLAEAGTSSRAPSRADVRYRLAGESQWKEQSLTGDNPVLKDTAQIAEMEVVYDHIGQNSYSIELFSVPIKNEEKLDEKTDRYITAQLLSAESGMYGAIGEQNIIKRDYKLKTLSKEGYFQSSLSPTTLNKGDNFSVKVDIYYMRYSNLSLYLVMPKGYVFTGYQKPGDNSFDGAVYEVSSREAGDNIIYAVKYTDGVVHTSGIHTFSFRVGPSVNTSKVQTDVKLPSSMYAAQDLPGFDFSQKVTEAKINMDIDGDGNLDSTLGSANSIETATINSVNALTAQSYVTSTAAAGENIDNNYRFDSTGEYRFYLYNGFNGGSSVSRADIIVHLPKKGSVFTYQDKDYTSQWDTVLTGKVSLSGDFLEDAAVSYSTDGGATYQQTVSDWSLVTHVKVASGSGKQLGIDQKASISFPFSAAFDPDMKLGSSYFAYFGTSMNYLSSQQGASETKASIQPSKLSAVPAEITGTVFKDYNANGTQDAAERSNNKSYQVKLYAGETAQGRELKSVTTNYDSGFFTTGILTAGTYTLKVEIGEGEYYEDISPFNDKGEYTFTIGGSQKPQLSNLKLGILSPRTMELNFYNADVVEGGQQRIIVPEIIPELLPEEGSVLYESSDESVVTVDNGRLNFVGEGSAVVTVKVPQLKSLQAQGGEEWLTEEVRVTCQMKGCHITAEPEISGDSAVYSGSENYYYYSFGRSGYCNAVPKHEDTKEVTVKITDSGTTGAEIIRGSKLTNDGWIRIRVTGTGSFTFQAEETWTHDAALAPEPLSYTVTVVPKIIASPSFDIQPSMPDGENGWYLTVPTVSLTQKQEGATVKTYFRDKLGAGGYVELTAEQRPQIKESGTYSFEAYSRETLKYNNSQTISSGNIKVDLKDPAILDTTKPSAVWVTSQTVRFLPKDEESGIASVNVTRDGEKTTCSAGPAGYYSFTAQENGTYEITVKDQAGRSHTENVVIDHIDTQKPQILSVTGIPADWVQEDQEISFEVTDTQSGVEESAVLVEKAAPDGSRTTVPCKKTGTVQDGFRFTFLTQGNGRYLITAADRSGRAAEEKQVTVEKVDAKGLSDVTVKKVPQGWQNKDITLEVTATPGASPITQFSYSLDNGASWSSPVSWGASNQFTIEKEGKYDNSVIVKVADEAGREKECRLEHIWLDKTPPAGSIIIEENTFGTFLHTISFGLFYNERVEVSIKADADLSGVEETVYFVSEQALTLQEVLQLTDWTEGTSFYREPEEKFIVYARLTDAAGNASYLSSEGIVLDSISPEIQGVEQDGIYCIAEKREAVITDGNLYRVMVNGEPLAIEEGKQAVFPVEEAGKTFAIEAKDSAGNHSSIRFSTAPGHLFGSWRPAGEDREMRVCVCGEIEYRDIDHQTGGTAVQSPEISVPKQELPPGEEILPPGPLTPGLLPPGSLHTEENMQKTDGTEEKIKGNNKKEEINTPEPSEEKNTDWPARIRSLLSDGRLLVREKMQTAKSNVSIKDKEEAARIVLSPSELALLEEGEDIEILLLVSDVSGEDLKEMEEKVKTVLPEGWEAGPALDISLLKRIGSRPEEKIQETQENMTIVIALPEEVLPPPGVKRSFQLLKTYEKDGRFYTDFIPDLDDSEETITISTNSYQSYQLIYCDEIVREEITQDTGEEISEEQQDKDTLLPFMTAIISFLLLLLLLLVYLWYRYRKNRKKQGNQEG